ncbi:MAG TPA: hypothetical protein VFE46_18500 [Pirellulales bacterium]|nr:hypothetical protein [Pirellulales bacterium]
MLAAIENAACAAGIGKNLRNLLRDIAAQFVPPPRLTLRSLTSWSVTVGAATPVTSFSSSAAQAPFDSDSLLRAEFFVKVLPRSRRAKLISLLLNNRHPGVAAFCRWLKGGVNNLVPCTARYFEACRHAMPSLESALGESAESLLGSEVLGHLEVIHRYLQHRLAPSAPANHTETGEAKLAIVDEGKLFQDLKQDPRFADFINEMPRLLADASLAVYRALVSTLPNPSVKHRLMLAADQDAGEIRQFLHLLCCQMQMVAEFTVSFVSAPATELEISCLGRVLQSAGKALYLAFLQRRFPALLTPLRADEAAFEEIEEDYSCLHRILDDAGRRLQDSAILPGAPAWLARCRIVSAELIQRLTTFTTWLEKMIEAAGGFDFTSDVLREQAIAKRSLDVQPWLEATSVVCGADTIETCRSKSVARVGHDILNLYRLFAADDEDVFNSLIEGCSCRHDPNGDSVSDHCNFISPAEVVGENHPLSLATPRIALLGVVVHAAACDVQRRSDWLETAQITGTPLRTVLFADDDAGQTVAFNLFSLSDVNKLKTTVQLMPMMSKYEHIYDALWAIHYELPQDAAGNPLPPEQFFMEILHEDDDDRDDDDKAPTPVPGIERTVFVERS